MWIIYTIISAVFESLKDTFGKISSIKTDEFTSAFMLHAMSMIILLPVVFLSPIPKLTPSFWIGSAMFLFITPMWSILYMKALKESPLSISLPMMAFNPIFTGLLAYAFDGKPFSMIGWVGALCISVGIYLNNFKPNQSIMQPIQSIIKESGTRNMLFVALLWSIGAHASKLRVDGSNALFSTFTGSVIGVVTILITACFSKKSIKFSAIHKYNLLLLPVGISYFLATYISSIALSVGSAANVFTLKRSSMLFSTLSGKYIFKEKLSIWKYVALTIIGVGMICISL